MVNKARKAERERGSKGARERGANSIHSISFADYLAQFQSALEKVLSDFNITSIKENQLAQLVKHYELMLRWNQRTNLTRIIEPVDAARLHYGESLFGAQFVGQAKTLLDIGSGAGFPGLPLAVALPEVEVTALEANQKKSLFLYEVKDALSLANFKIAGSRVEAFDLSTFERLTSRALDRADEMMPQVLKRMRAEQKLMLYCAPDMVDHLKKQTAEKLVIETHAIPQSDSRLIAIFSHI
ncbi:MAG: 16S rRNA (guanine(527)-N(7))-methyltransferase RsmG [Acidobacteriota bacterium]